MYLVVNTTMSHEEIFSEKVRPGSNVELFMYEPNTYLGQPKQLSSTVDSDIEFIAAKLNTVREP